MKNKLPLFVATSIMLCSCHVNKTQTTSAPRETAGDKGSDALASKSLSGRMQIKDTIKVGDPILLKFTVFNNTDTRQHFCKWHTPFEPLMSKYLEIKNEAGEEVLYQGPMAKRVMPPPASSYLNVTPKDNISASVDLLKAYSIASPGKYTVTYVGQQMSDVVVTESISFFYQK